MTHLDALIAVEKKAGELGIKDCYGDTVDPFEAVFCVGEFAGDRWTDLNRRFVTGEITPDDYQIECFKIIHEYAVNRQRGRVTKKLKSMRTV